MSDSLKFGVVSADHGLRKDFVAPTTNVAQGP